MSRATVAGILGLVSLVLPLELFTYAGGFGVDWTIFGVDFYDSTSKVFNVSQLDTVDAVLSVLLLVVVLVGSVLLLALRGKPRVGAILLVVGVLLFIADLIHDQVAYPGSPIPLPVGFFVIVAGSVIGFVAKPAQSVQPVGA